MTTEEATTTETAEPTTPAPETTEAELDDDELDASDETDLDKLQTNFPVFRGPVSMLLRLEEHASAANLNSTQFMKKIVADHIGFALQSNGSRARLTEEEKKERQRQYQEKAKQERARVRALIEAAQKTSTGK